MRIDYRSSLPSSSSKIQSPCRGRSPHEFHLPRDFMISLTMVSHPLPFLRCLLRASHAFGIFAPPTANRLSQYKPASVDQTWIRPCSETRQKWLACRSRGTRGSKHMVAHAVTSLSDTQALASYWLETSSICVRDTVSH